MKITSRVTAAACLLAQWMGVAAVVYVGKVSREIWSILGGYLPRPVFWAMDLTRLQTILPLALLTSAGVLCAERYIRTESSRYMIQIACLIFWFCLVTFVLVALFYPHGVIGMAQRRAAGG
jgi:hypothetical protein